MEFNSVAEAKAVGRMAWWRRVKPREEKVINVDEIYNPLIDKFEPNIIYTLNGTYPGRKWDKVIYWLTAAVLTAAVTFGENHR